MKTKLLTLVLLLTSIVSFSSCSNDIEDELSNNPLRDTLWSLEEVTSGFWGGKDEYVRYIEFVGNSNVKIWDTYNNNVYNGTYKVNGNKVEFYNLHDKYWLRYYVDGTFSTRSLTVNFSYKANDKTSTFSDTYTKE